LDFGAQVGKRRLPFPATRTPPQFFRPSPVTPSSSLPALPSLSLSLSPLSLLSLSRWFPRPFSSPSDNPISRSPFLSYPSFPFLLSSSSFSSSSSSSSSSFHRPYLFPTFPSLVWGGDGGGGGWVGWVRRGVVVGGWDGMWGDEVIRRKERKGKRWGR